MEILDSGARREFGTGAVRDISDDKGRCDLLPLKFIGDRLESNALKFIEEYIRFGDVHSLWFSIDAIIEREGMDIYTAILEVSRQYQEGARKYSDRNWEKGIPVHCFIDSGIRHYIKFLRGDTDEPHFRATIWNLLGAIWMHENHPELIDLPFKEAVNE